MNLQEINEVITKYEELLRLARNRIGILSTLDRYYNTALGIKSISFGLDDVYVSYLNRSMSSEDDIISFKFPLNWLAVDEIVLEQKVMEAKQQRYMREEEKKLKNIKYEQEIEYARYLELKEKYENKK